MVATRATTETGERDKLEKAVSPPRAAGYRQQQARTGPAEGSDLVDALQLGVDKTRAKLEAAELALQAFVDAGQTAPQQAVPTDAASVAIARAVAARAADAALDPVEKPAPNWQAFEQRLKPRPGSPRAEVRRSREKIRNTGVHGGSARGKVKALPERS